MMEWKWNHMMRLNNISKIYKNGKLTVPVLHNIDLEIDHGEFVAIMGPSGSGKSTLMNIIGFLDSPTGGTYELNSNVINFFNENKLANLRNKHIGFVFQQFFLVTRQNELKNVEAPLIYADITRRERRERTKVQLTKVGISDG